MAKNVGDLRSSKPPSTTFFNDSFNSFSDSFIFSVVSCVPSFNKENTLTFHDQVHNTILLLIQKGQYIRYCLFMKFQKAMSKIRCCLFIKTNTKIKKSDAKFILFFKRQVLTFSGIPS